MKYLKKFNEASTEVVDKLLVQLSSVNSAGESKKHWTIGDPHLKEFLDRYVNLLKDHLDYIDSDKITLTGDKIKILL